MTMLKILGIVICVVALDFASPAYAGRTDCQGDLCNIYKRSTAKPLAPAATSLVCIRLEQAKRGRVVLRIYGAGGKELDKGNPQHDNVKGTLDQFCVGRHYLVASQQQGGYVELCNDVKNRILPPELIAILLRSGMPANGSVHLFATR